MRYFRSALRWIGLLGALAPLGCGELIGLGDLNKVDCVAPCRNAGGSGGSGGVAAESSGTRSVGDAGGLENSGLDGAGRGGSSAGIEGGASVGGVSAGGNAPAGAAQGGALVAGSSGTNAAGTLAGTSGESGSVDGPLSGFACPGGAEPAATWQEHWMDHSQLLTRVYYDDCIALYFDDDVSPAIQTWLVSFLDRSWSYTLATYGSMGPERLYVVVHQGRHLGGHTASFIEASHDGHATIDMGALLWLEGAYDVPARLLGTLVDTQGAHTKFGAPKAQQYGQGFALIYTYDLYQALELDTVAAEAQLLFAAISNSQPADDTYWFRDWFYPLWLGFGHAQVFVNYLSLLQKYYPAGGDMRMPAMNYGQYFHFMSGAAGVDLAPLARSAFAWRSDFDAQIAAAKQAFPDVKY